MTNKELINKYHSEINEEMATEVAFRFSKSWVREILINRNIIKASPRRVSRRLGSEAAAVMGIPCSTKIY